jgi:hypothetical protein
MTRIQLSLTLVIASTVPFASTVLAQSRVHQVTVTNELPHLELSAGLTTMAGGAGSDSARQMRALDLDDRAARFPRKMPPWSQPGLGLFAQGHIAVAEHVTIGYLVSFTQQDTHGARTATDTVPGTLIYSSYVDAHEAVRTHAVIVSLRPNAWMRIGLGPAIHERTFELRTSAPEPIVVGPRDGALGWVAAADLKFRRAPVGDLQTPGFLHLVGQYAAAGSGVSGPAVIALGSTYAGNDLGSVSWPATRLAFSHWMVGIGAGLEF